MELIDGKEISNKMLDTLKSRVKTFDFVPTIAVLLIGEDKSSKIYVDIKKKQAEKIGVEFNLYVMESGVEQDIIIDTISFLNKDKDVDGIIVQLPLPKYLDTDKIIASIDKDKDVDGFKKENIDGFIKGKKDVIAPVFPKALLRLAQSTLLDLSKKKGVIIGKSDIFVKAMVAMGKSKGLEIVEVSCSEIVKNKNIIKEADIVFTACGKLDILEVDFLKKDAVVIDGGINVVDNKTFGDVDLKKVEEKVSFITPVPGGVGPVTVACLFENLVELAIKNKS